MDVICHRKAIWMHFDMWKNEIFSEQWLPNNPKNNKQQNKQQQQSCPRFSIAGIYRVLFSVEKRQIFVEKRKLLTYTILVPHEEYINTLQETYIFSCFEGGEHENSIVARMSFRLHLVGFINSFTTKCQNFYGNFIEYFKNHDGFFSVWQ